MDSAVANSDVSPVISDVTRGDEFEMSFRTKKRGRNKTMMSAYWNGKKDEVIIEWNDHGQPVGGGAKTLSSYIGVVDIELAIKGHFDAVLDTIGKPETERIGTNLLQRGGYYMTLQGEAGSLADRYRLDFGLPTATAILLKKQIQYCYSHGIGSLVGNEVALMDLATITGGQKARSTPGSPSISPSPNPPPLPPLRCRLSSPSVAPLQSFAITAMKDETFSHHLCFDSIVSNDDSSAPPTIVDVVNNISLHLLFLGD
ncbi:hypothetical protein QJS10_CPA01g02072 [Acorus calamus]|uniref:Uncharacterized protein n=1 Tax=Acorus calamus TaxID=4465 RepID=A0AAV9FGI8_ACOCL|nr:hypothetical protein QJS10_CPA01g02072 [Acorus calamus]